MAALDITELGQGAYLCLVLFISVLHAVTTPMVDEVYDKKKYIQTFSANYLILFSDVQLRHWHYYRAMFISPHYCLVAGRRPGARHGNVPIFIHSEKPKSWRVLIFCSFPGNETSPESFLLHNALARKPKRIRTAFSPSQLLRLEHAFEKNHYVVGAERKQLAHSLSLTETQVRNKH